MQVVLKNIAKFELFYPRPYSLTSHSYSRSHSRSQVYFCSGQSNMEFSLNNAFNATEEIADSVRYPGIRMFTAAKTTADSQSSLTTATKQVSSE
jgi:hypothetical protein